MHSILSILQFHVVIPYSHSLAIIIYSFTIILNISLPDIYSIVYPLLSLYHILSYRSISRSLRIYFIPFLISHSRAFFHLQQSLWSIVKASFFRLNSIVFDPLSFYSIFKRQFRFSDSSFDKKFKSNSILFFNSIQFLFDRIWSIKTQLWSVLIHFWLLLHQYFFNFVRFYSKNSTILTIFHHLSIEIHFSSSYSVQFHTIWT